MRSNLKKCTKCGRYTLKSVCPVCLSETICPVPMKFSPDDNYGSYRRTAIKQEYGENGKYHKI
ncbi:MAG: RNA-protein complex protein Nop10 [Candidatus Methanogranum gryphiswaldense]|nr:MAG: RNA-protein complex protein Nop10 [Candidatus Methanogranum sp. U3.2.1]